MKMITRACALALALTSFADTATAATLINGDFETGDFSGWNIALTDNGDNNLEQITSFDASGNGAASNAANFRVGVEDLGGIDGGISLSQVFSVTTAGVYDFGINVAGVAVDGGNSDGGTFKLLVNGTLLDQFASGSVDVGRDKSASLFGSLDLGVGEHTFDVLMTRRFLANGAFAQQFVDDAFVTGPDLAPVPLPASFLLLLGGLAGLSALRRKEAA